MRRLPIICCSTPVRRRTRPVPAGSAIRSTGSCCRVSSPAFRSCFPAGSTPAMSPRRSASPVRPASTYPRASSARRDKRIPTRFAPSSAPCGKRMLTWPQLPGAPHEHAAAEHVPRRSRRARTFRDVRRPFRRRDLDAARPRARSGLCAREIRSAFQAEMNGYLVHYVGRPSPLYFAERMSEHLGGAKIYFKREDLNHTGAHKVNNVLGQILLARRMGKQRIIAETGAGMHGVATATLCAKFGFPCVVYMGTVDVERQQPNVLRMRALGAEVRPVESGSKTLKDAMNEALRDWVTNVETTFYCIGTV